MAILFLLRMLLFLLLMLLFLLILLILLILLLFLLFLLFLLLMLLLLQQQRVCESCLKWQVGQMEGEIEVSVPLQFLVEDGRLALASGSKHNLWGFADPAPGEPKQLQVEYQLQGTIHSITVADCSALELGRGVA